MADKPPQAVRQLHLPGINPFANYSELTRVQRIIDPTDPFQVKQFSQRIANRRTMLQAIKKLKNNPKNT